MKKFQARIKSFLRLKSKQSDKPLTEPEPEPELGAGAVVPQELFQRILYFVSRNDGRRAVQEQFYKRNRENPQKYKRIRSNDEKRREYMTQFHSDFHKAGPAYTLRSCSLVCRYWANQSRIYLFYGQTIEIRSLEDAEAFRRYVMAKNKLIPLYKLLHGVNVTQSYSSPRSFAALVDLPSTHRKLLKLILQGPAPDGFQPQAFNTPHWGAVSLSNPPVASYKAVDIRDVHFPSFGHIVKLLKYFKDTEEFRFWSVHWDGKVSEDWVQLQQTAKHHYRRKVLVQARKCTDSLLLSLQTIMIFPDFPLRTVPERDWRWSIKVMTYLRDFYLDHNVPAEDHYGIQYSLGASSHSKTKSRQRLFMFSITNLAREYPNPSVYFTCELKPKTKQGVPSGRLSPSLARIVGMAVMIWPALRHKTPNEFFTVDLSALRREIEHRCVSRIVVFAFGNYSTMQALLEKHPALKEPMAHGYTYLLACRHSPGDPTARMPDMEGERKVHDTWVAIDPVTLQRKYGRYENSIIQRVLGLQSELNHLAY